MIETIHESPSVVDDVHTEIEAIKGKKFEQLFGFKTQIVWHNVLLMVTGHSLTVYYLFTLPLLQYKGLLLAALILGDLNVIGITAGVHRLWTHRAYKAKLPLQIILALLFYGAAQHSIYRWVKDHRLHHKYSDSDADPYNSSRGFFFCHIGWIMMRKHPEAVRRNKAIDMSDLDEYPIIKFLDNHSVLMRTLFCFILPVVIPVYFFNQELEATFAIMIAIRYPYVQHTIWSVNSFSHMFGYRSYDKYICPAENPLVAAFGGGEGWHNYHHSFPSDYRLGEFSTFFHNIRYNHAAAFIDLFAKVGWAYDLKMASPDLIRRFVERKGDGSHPVFESKVFKNSATEFKSSPPFEFL